MDIISTIEFKSIPVFFDKEQSGTKNNTFRVVSIDEDKDILAQRNNIKFIRIVSTDSTNLVSISFTRTITDISRYEHESLIIYIFTWRI